MTLVPDRFPLGARSAPSDGALLDAESAHWRLRHIGGVVMSMAKARAALLQIAHPKIGAGLADHSSFDADPYRRIRITGQTVSAIQFGSVAERTEALRLLGRLHASVRGTLASGGTYRANDPELMWFVLATLIESDLLVERLYVRAFDERDRDTYFAESLALADAFGIPASIAASDRFELDEFISSGLAGFDVGPDARRLAQRIFEPTYLRAPRPLIWGYRLLMLDLLPPQLRRAYGFAEYRSPAGRIVVSASRALLPRLPRRARQLKLKPRRLTGCAHGARRA